MEDPTVNKILFLCTGNYFRSRLAEEVFNYLAKKHELNWEAYSEGLAKTFSPGHNPGTISIHTRRFLKFFRIPITGLYRYPKHFEPARMHEYQLIVMVNKVEHEPLLKEWIKEIPDNISAWNVKDVYEVPPVIETYRLYRKVVKLFHSIRQNELVLRQALKPAM